MTCTPSTRHLIDGVEPDSLVDLRTGWARRGRAALEEGVLGVSEGGVRQIIFPPELGYPMVGDQRDGKMADPSHDRVGPKPTILSRGRAPRLRAHLEVGQRRQDVVVELQGRARR